MPPFPWVLVGLVALTLSPSLIAAVAVVLTLSPSLIAAVAVVRR